MQGIGTKRTLGGASTSLLSFLLHPHPSRYIPWQYTPSGAPSLTSSGSCLVTSVKTATSSRAQPVCERVTSWRHAVRNPWPLVKPGSQYDLGRPVLIHLSHCSNRESRLWYQTPTVGENHAPLSQSGGTLALASESSESARSSDMTMVPSIASCRFCKVARTLPRINCNTSISCLSEMWMGLVAPALFRYTRTSSFLNCGGSLLRRSLHSSVTISSRDAPFPPPPPLGWVSRIVLKTFSALSNRNTKSAFMLRPNTSGESVEGYVFTCSRNTPMSVVCGTV
mmetsp:Transcript_8279/g.13121  ORF Transcript_8279/g.13121 Transcript_8279/m.13121 type:complete len:281 (+) Transcript_8279:272-1114(+)